MNRIRQAIVILGFLALSAGVQNALAAAPSTTPPATSQEGANTFIQPPPMENAGPPLLFDTYGLTDYTAIPGAAGSGGVGEVNVPNDSGNAIAAAEAGGLYMLGFVATRLVEWAFSLDIVGQLGAVVDQFTHSLESGLYGAYMPIILILVAAICAWLLLVMRRFWGGIGGLLWAGLALALATQLFIAPSGFLNQVDGVATGVTNSVIVGAAHDTQGAPIGTFQAPGSSKDYEVRLLANELWTVAVYDPWTAICFGSVDPKVNGDQLGMELLKKNAGQPNNYDKDISAAPQWMQDWANGNDGVARALFGFFVGLVGLLLLMMVLMIDLAIIVAQLSVVVLGMLTLPVWLIAPIPGFGHRLILKWFAGIVTGFLVSTIAALYLVLMLVLLGALNSLSSEVGLIVVGILDVAAIVIALWLRKTLFALGRHGAQLPMSVAGVSSQPDASVGPAHPVVRTAHRNLQVASNRMIKPLYGETAIAAALPASAGAPALNGAAKNGAANNGAANNGVSKNGAAKNGAAKVATGAAKKAPAAAARKAGTAGAAKTAVGTVGVKGGSAAAAGAGAGLMTGGLALVAYGGMRAAQTGIHLYDRARHQTVGAVLGGIGQQTGPRPQPLAPHEGPSFTSASWAYAGRVSKAGMKAVRGQRVKPLEQDGGSKPRATPPRTPPAHQRVKEPAKS